MERSKSSGFQPVEKSRVVVPPGFPFCQDQREPTTHCAMRNEHVKDSYQSN
jgi:hypothetical protein